MKTSIFGVALAALVVASLVPDTMPLIANVPEWITNAAHVPVYGAITALALSISATDAGEHRHEALVVLGLLCLGAAIELVQAATGRSASPLDLVLNAAGIGSAVAIRRRCRRDEPTSRSGSEEHGCEHDRRATGSIRNSCRDFR